MTVGGVRCVVVDKRLEAIEPKAWRFLLNFAKDNELRTHRAAPAVEPVGNAG